MTRMRVFSRFLVPLIVSEADVVSFGQPGSSAVDDNYRSKTHAHPHRGHTEGRGLGFAAFALSVFPLQTARVLENQCLSRPGCLLPLVWYTVYSYPGTQLVLEFL